VQQHATVSSMGTWNNNWSWKLGQPRLLKRRLLQQHRYHYCSIRCSPTGTMSINAGGYPTQLDFFSSSIHLCGYAEKIKFGGDRAKNSDCLEETLE
ncbi:hypothetical protein L195_g027881, partial [Trifolium pratense]